MKKVQKYFKILLFLIIINMFGIPNVSAATNPYNQTGPYGTNCTWYAWKMAYEKAGVTLPGWGNAKDWYNDAKNAGYTVGTTPKANSIIVWGDWTSYGHVGYVESVEDNILHVWDSTGPCIDEEDKELRECIENGVSEETDKICYANAKRIACKYTISPDQYGITGYIYLDYAPKTSNAKSSSTNNTSKNVEVTKSSNTYLSNIELSSGTIVFDKGTLQYNVEVDNEIDTLTVTATLEDNKSTVTGTGDYKLNEGLNEIRLTVTAEDNSTKEYVINVTRHEKQEEVKIILETKNNQNEKNITQNTNQQIMILILSIFFLILLIVSFIFVWRKKHHNKDIKNKK